MSRLRVATYNVHKCRGVDGRTRVGRIRRVIEEVWPDILATQEILRSQADLISQDLALPYWFGTARQHAGEDYGNATFTRLPAEDSECFDVTIAPREPRQCIRVKAGGVNFFNIHLGTSIRERRQQAHLLAASDFLCRPEFAGTRIVAGDFNEWLPGLVTRLFRQTLSSAHHTHRAGERTTYPGLFPVLPLDRIYYDPSFRLETTELHRTRTSLVASDHLPLVTELRVLEHQRP